MSDGTSQRDAPASAAEIEVTPGDGRRRHKVRCGASSFTFVLCDDEEQSKLAIKQAFEAMLRVHLTIFVSMT